MPPAKSSGPRRRRGPVAFRVRCGRWPPGSLALAPLRGLAAGGLPPLEVVGDGLGGPPLTVPTCRPRSALRPGPSRPWRRRSGRLSWRAGFLALAGAALALAADFLARPWRQPPWCPPSRRRPSWGRLLSSSPRVSLLYGVVAGCREPPPPQRGEAVAEGRPRLGHSGTDSGPGPRRLRGFRRQRPLSAMRRSPAGPSPFRECAGSARPRPRRGRRRGAPPRPRQRCRRRARSRPTAAAASPGAAGGPASASTPLCRRPAGPPRPRRPAPRPPPCGAPAAPRSPAGRAAPRPAARTAGRRRRPGRPAQARRSLLVPLPHVAPASAAPKTTAEGSALLRPVAGQNLHVLCRRGGRGGRTRRYSTRYSRRVRDPERRRPRSGGTGRYDRFG